MAENARESRDRGQVQGPRMFPGIMVMLLIAIIVAGVVVAEVESSTPAGEMELVCNSMHIFGGTSGAVATILLGLGFVTVVVSGVKRIRSGEE